MDEEKNVSALVMWNELFSQLIKEPFRNTATQKALTNRQYLSIFTGRIDTAIAAGRFFEITKHRVIVDALVAQGLETDTRMQSNIKAFEATWWIQRGKRRRLLRAIDDITLEQSVWRRALHTVVNTVPPGDIEWLTRLAIKVGTIKGNIKKEEDEKTN